MTEVQVESTQEENAGRLGALIESPFASAGLACASCALAITVVVSGIGLVHLILA